MKPKKLLQILYPGLGGHTSVAFSLIEADFNLEFLHTLVGFGIEKPSLNFISKATDLNVMTDTVLKNRGFDIKSQLRLYRILKRDNPDILIMHSTSLVLIVWFYCLVYNKKWITVEHQSNNAKGLKDWMYSFLILCLSPKIVYLTKSYKEEILRKFKCIPNKKTHVIGNGINLDKIKNTNKKNKFFTRDTINITMISRVNILRDHKTLIDAFVTLLCTRQNLRLYIAGDGERLNDLIHYIESLNMSDKIYLMGNLKEEGVIDLLNKTDVYVHSSLAETLSTSLLQVMSCEVPIIATDIDGINNLLINEQDALLFQPKNVEQLVDKIDYLLNNPSLTKQIISNAYNKVKRLYDHKAMFNRYKALFN